MTTRTTTPARTEPRMTDETGVRFGLTVATQVVVVLGCGLAGGPGVIVGILLVAATARVGQRLPVLVLLACGVTAWAWWTGFVEHSFGELTVGPADLVRLGLIVVGTWLAAHW